MYCLPLKFNRGHETEKAQRRPMCISIPGIYLAFRFGDDGFRDLFSMLF